MEKPRNDNGNNTDNWLNVVGVIASITPYMLMALGGCRLTCAHEGVLHEGVRACMGTHGPITHGELGARRTYFLRLKTCEFKPPTPHTASHT